MLPSKLLGRVDVSGGSPRRKGRWSWLHRSAATHRRCGRDARYRALECFGVEDLAASAGCQEPTIASQIRPASGDHFSSRSADRRCWPGARWEECGQHGVPGGVSDLVAAVGARREITTLFEIPWAMMW